MVCRGRDSLARWWSGGPESWTVEAPPEAVRIFEKAVRPTCSGVSYFSDLAAGRWCFGLVARGALGCGPGGLPWPHGPGLWGLVARRPGAAVAAYGRLGHGALHARHVGRRVDRARRLLRQSEGWASKTATAACKRFWRPAGHPNGVVLLDSEGHIEWCNQIAASQFGIDAQRDVMQSIGNLVRDPDFSAYAARMILLRRGAAGRDSKLPARAHFGTCIRMATGASCCSHATSRPGAGRRHAPRFRGQRVHEIRTPLTVLIGFIETLQTLPLFPAGAGPLPGHDVAASLAHAKRGAGFAHAIPTGRQPLPGMTEWTPCRR